MKFHIINKTLFSFLLICLHGCETYYYMPTLQNVPLFEEKNEIQATFGGDGYMFNVQSAYSITNHIGSQLNFMTGKKNKYYLIEGGVGYFLRFWHHVAFETYCGYGYGRISSQNNIFSFGVNRFSLQPSLGLTFKFFEIAYTVRFTDVKFNLKTNGVISPPYEEKYGIYNMEKQKYFFYEPGITIRLGSKFLKLQYQYVEANKLNSDILKYIHANHSLSVLITIPLNDKNINW
jgi:hypothetical protein